MLYRTNDLMTLRERYLDEKDPDVRETLTKRDAEAVVDLLNDELISLGDRIITCSHGCEFNGKVYHSKLDGYRIIRSKDLMEEFIGCEFHIALDEEKKKITGTFYIPSQPLTFLFKGIYIDDIERKIEDELTGHEVYDLMENERFRKFMTDNGFEI